MTGNRWRGWTAICFLIGLSAIAIIASRDGLLTSSNTRIFWSAAWATTFLAIVPCLFLMVATSPSQFLVWFFHASLGAAVGWLLGILLTPSTSREATHFTQLQTSAAGLLSGALATQIGALWQKLVDGDHPRIFEKTYAIPLLIFLSTGLVSLGAQYNIREYGPATVIVGLEEGQTLPIDQSSGHSVWNGQALRFIALVAYPDDPSVEWTLESSDALIRKWIADKLIVVDPALGTLTNKVPKEKLIGGNVLDVTALSHFNHAWTGAYPLQIGPSPAASATTTTTLPQKASRH